MFSQQNVELYFTSTKFSLHKTSKDGKTTFLHPVKIDIKMYFVELNAKWISFELKFKPLLFNLLKLSQCLYSKLKMCFCSVTIILKMANNSFEVLILSFELILHSIIFVDWQTLFTTIFFLNLNKYLRPKYRLRSKVLLCCK